MSNWNNRVGLRQCRPEKEDFKTFMIPSFCRSHMVAPGLLSTYINYFGAWVTTRNGPTSKWMATVSQRAGKSFAILSSSQTYPDVVVYISFN